jgi:glutathione S-transferase
MPVLGYWNIRGLCEPIRLMLEYLAVPYDDKRYNYGTVPGKMREEWEVDKHKLGLDFPNLPYLIEGDVRLTQSCAIQRYIARKHNQNLLGATEADKARTDLIEQQCVDFRNGLSAVAYGADFDKHRVTYVAALPDKLRPFDTFLGGKHDWFGGSQVSLADFMMYATLHTHRLLAPDAVNSFEHLKAFMKRFEALPHVSEYLKSDRFRNSALNGATASWGSGPIN